MIVLKELNTDLFDAEALVICGRMQLQPVGSAASEFQVMLCIPGSNSSRFCFAA